MGQSVTTAARWRAICIDDLSIPTPVHLQQQESTAGIILKPTNHERQADVKRRNEGDMGAQFRPHEHHIPDRDVEILGEVRFERGERNTAFVSRGVRSHLNANLLRSSS